MAAFHRFGLAALIVGAGAGADRVESQTVRPPGPRMRLLVIPARFADSPLPPVTRTALQQQLFDGPSDSGTLPEFFAEASGGRLQVTGEVHEWVDTPIRADQWLLPGIEFFAMRVDYAAAAVRAADATADYGLYDNDGPDGVPNSGDDDGVVDGGVTFLWAEIQSTCNGTALHPSAIFLTFPGLTPTPIRTADRTPDGREIAIHAVSFASSVDCSGTRIAGIAVIAHELGHQAFGLTDRYSAQGADRLTQRRWVAGCWNIMAAGSGWGCGAGPEAHWRTPTLYGPIERRQLGWLTPTVVPQVRDQVFVLRPAARDGNVLRIPSRPGATDFFQIEYRQQLGFDAGIPASGVLVYTIDESIALTAGCTGTCRSYQEQVIEADGRNDLLWTIQEGGNRGDPGDVFGAPNRRTFTGGTSPAARARNGSFSTLTIHDIEVDEARQEARIRLSTAATPAFLRTDGTNLALAALDRVDLIVRAAGGSLPYAWNATGLPAGVTLSVFPGTDSVALSGTVADAGAFTPTISLSDPLGNTIQTALTWSVATAQLAINAVLRRILQGETSQMLTPPEAQYLDRMGNRNNRFDIGDARAEWSRNHS